MAIITTRATTGVTSGTGTITTATNSTTVTGSSTLFTTEVKYAGKALFTTGDVYIGTISSITNDTTIVLTANATVQVTGAAYKIGYQPKAAPLSNAEIDTNFINLNNNKLETGDATPVSIVNTVVRRDSSGNFAANTITANTFSGPLSGNASTATTLQTARTINDISFNGSANISITEYYHSQRDFTNGTLITTTIDYSVSSGDPFILEIKGNSYGSGIPFDIQLQGYIYSDTIINYGGWSVGPSFNIIAQNVGGKLCFWFARQVYWQGFNVNCYTASGPGRAVNRTVSVTDVVDPVGTKRVTFTPKQVLRDDNYNSYAPTLTGTGASGTWAINISGTAAVATSANATNTSNNFQMNSLGVGTAGSGTAGQIRATNSIVSYYSDERLKENIRPIENALDKIDALAGVLYTQNKLAENFGYIDYSQQVGVLAQQVEKVQPEAVTLAPFDIDEQGESKTGENYLTVQYERLVPLLIEGIKELRKEIKELKERK